MLAWPLSDRGHLAGVNADPVFGYDVAQEADGGPAELALGRLGVELVVQQPFDHHPHVHEVLFARIGEDEDVVTVHLHEPSIGGQLPGRAWPVASNDRTGPKIECMYRMRIDDKPCRPKAPTRNSYWPPGTRKEVLNCSSSRMRNCM
jgi:hypothetical protein